MSNQSPIDDVISRSWSYEFDLPDGRRTRSCLPADVMQMHSTRLEMLISAMGPVVAGDWGGNSVVDLACHQGYFASHLARKGCPVLGVDARPEHLADVDLIARTYGLTNLRTKAGDVNTMRPDDLGQFDITLMLGLLHQVESPVGAIRLARALSRKACIVETLVVPNQGGMIDWGSNKLQRPLIGSFGVIDETAETRGPGASTTGFCVAPSYETLVFLMRKLGFARVERIAVPEGGYEQLVSGKRVMVIGHVDHVASDMRRRSQSSHTFAQDPSPSTQHAFPEAGPVPQPSPAANAPISPLKFSGERYIPDEGWANIAYEHLSRYLFAEPLAAEKHVLDVGSGEGYGAHLLSGSAVSVVGVDVSPEAVQHANGRYAVGSPGLRYVLGSATMLPAETGSIDLVVAFEVLEHMSEHELMLAEIRRVLRPGGVLLISTPNKVAYSDLPSYRNPFHVKELYFGEFRALVARHFQAARYFSQKNLAGSLIAVQAEDLAEPLRVRRIRRKDASNEFEPTSPETSDHMYFIAACSDSADSLAGLSGVVVADRDERLVREPQEGAERRLSELQQTFAAHARDWTIVDDAMRSAMSLAGTLRMDRRVDTNGSVEDPVEQDVYDLIVPIFNSPEILKGCLDSLIANTSPRHLIHVIDDASTDPRVDLMMKSYAARYPHIRYYRLPVNLGFPGAVNAGFSSTTRDVVLVNSDTEYPPNWLARMDRCRRSDPAIHTVCPLSNNATICSVPGFNEKNALPPHLTVADMDRLVQQTSLRRYPRAPTVVGFCMLITRRAIVDVGPFDMIFGRGYGEEVDWCQRAWALGYEAAICDDLYVYHHGEVGFSQVPERQLLRETNERRISERWPRYIATVKDYCALNPLRYQQHKLYERLRHKSPAQTRVLHVTHNFDGLAGTELFTRQLVDGMRLEVASTVLYPAALSPFQDGAVEEEGRGLLEGGLLKVRMNVGIFPVDRALRGVAMSLRSHQAERFFAEVLAASDAQVVQFSHLANLGSIAFPLVAKAMGARVVVVLHDYFLLCPDWNLLHRSGVSCGEARAAAQNSRCLDCLGPRIQSRPGLAPLNVADFVQERNALVRAVLQQADVLIAPSYFVRDQFTRAWGKEIGNRIRVVPHGTVAYPFQADYRPQEELRVAFLGNANSLKGVDIFAEAARQMRGSRIRFRIIGGLVPGSTISARDNLELNGPYAQRELPRLLQSVDVVFIGSIVNETYCYTLEEAFRAGAPVIATAVGAIPERVMDGETGILIPPHSVSALVSAIERLDGDRALLAAMRHNVQRLRLRSVKETISEYARLYAELASDHPSASVIRSAMTAQAHARADAPVGLREFLDGRDLEIKLPLVPESVVAAGGKKAKPR